MEIFKYIQILNLIQNLPNIIRDKIIIIKRSLLVIENDVELQFEDIALG